MSASYALLVASLGNPGLLQNTRHSAGHILLKSLARHLKTPPFSRSAIYGSGGTTTITTNLPSSSSSPTREPPATLTLWQSPTQMNKSGAAVLRAWRAFCREHGHSSTSSTNPDGDAPGLILLHDDLEVPRGTLQFRHGLTKSTRGHNGLKSVLASFGGAGIGSGSGKDGDRLLRISIGIGRPDGEVRGRGEVSDYVLAPCTGAERERIEGLAGRLEEVLMQEGNRIVKERV